MGFSFNSLRVKLTLLVLIAVLPLLGLIIYIGLNERDHFRSMALQNALSLSKSISESQERIILNAHNLLFFVSQVMGEHHYSPVTLKKMFGILSPQTPELTGLIIADADGEVIANTYQVSPEISISNLPFYRRVMQKKDFVIGEYQMSRFTGKHILTVAIPILDKDSKVKKIIAAGIDVGHFKQVMDKQSLPTGTHVNVFDHNGTVLFRYPAPGNYVGKMMPQADVIKEALNKTEGVIEARGVDGYVRLYGFTSFGRPAESIYVSVGIPPEVAFSQINRALVQRLIWLIVFTGLALTLAWFWGEFFILRIMGRLLGAAKRVATGDLHVRVGAPYGKGEVGQLAKAFDLMVDELQQRESANEKAVAALHESEKRYRSLVETSPDGVLLIDTNGATILMANRQGISSLGYEKAEEMIGRSVFDFFAKEDSALVIKNFKQTIQRRGSRNILLNILKKDGTSFPAEINTSVIRDEENPASSVVLAIFRDITARKGAEDALKESEKSLKDAQRLAHIGSWEWTIATDTVTWSEELCNISGRDPLLPVHSVREMSSCYTPESWQRLGTAIDRTLLYGEPYTLDLEMQLPDGKVRLVNTQGVADYDAWGRIVKLRGTVHDITELKRMESERRILEERLQRSEKMEALGQLAGGVAHDLNNVLGALMGYSELLLEKIPEGNNLRIYADNILKSTEKGGAIIQDLLTLARRGVTVSRVINLNPVVATFLRSPVFEKLHADHPQVTCRTELDKSLLNIKGSPIHLEKTVMNLITNAMEAISARGEIAIQTENRYLDRIIGGYDEIKEGDYVVLTVSDTGGGINPDDLGKIFEPFYTKKVMGRSGTGLGLAIVWGTVKDHSGYIDVQSECGKGTTFTLYFPVTREELGDELRKIPPDQYQGRGEAILVVDDVAEQRDIAARILTRLGYKVHAVSRGEEAVEYIRVNKTDLLVLDMILDSGIDGLETYQRILQVNPQQKAVIVSGFAETERVKKAQELGAGSYVRKPYLMEKIGRAVREELGRK